MRKGGGRAKGAGFELNMARVISVWWTGKPELAKVRAEELPFRRTPLSGGWDRKAAASDLLVTDASMLLAPWPFAPEMKCQEVWDWEGLFKNNDKWPVKAYWDQCCSAAKKSLLHPLVVFTKNRSPVYFAVTPEVADVLSLPHVRVTWLPFVIGKFDDLLALDPQQVVAFLSQISASSIQAKGVAKPVANPVQERPVETREEPASRVLGGEPEKILPVARPMMLKNYHGKWKKVPVPMKDWKPVDETKILGVSR